MLKKIMGLIEAHWDVVTYLVFGVLTTVVNYAIYLPCLNLLGLSAAVSNSIAWVVAVAFAYVTNKPFVFGSHDWSMKVVIPELGKFVATRVSSGNGNIWKLVTQVLVIIINYVGSKLLVFRKGK